MKEIYQVMKAERDAISIMMEDTDKYDPVVEVLANCKGKVVFMAVGKSGHVGKKLAATFASTGTPSFFVHADEAQHGDFGMLEPQDVVILISNSGKTAEVVNDIPFVHNIGCTTIALTSKADSPLAKGCKYQLIYPDLPEADHLGLAPTTSSTLALVLGDAIACALSIKKGFTRQDFYKYHPGGNLGKVLSEEAK